MRACAACLFLSLPFWTIFGPVPVWMFGGWLVPVHCCQLVRSFAPRTSPPALARCLLARGLDTFSSFLFVVHRSAATHCALSLSPHHPTPTPLPIMHHALASIRHHMVDLIFLVKFWSLL
ncbi:hypothetical protein JB92DRAFT_1949838 [Gautieria morchelliformis]|nr:hypothetical protein JB92DRAFT_1949838 [Gautieria morchelliformis]